MNTELFLRTKISIPPPRPEFIRRPRLTDRINSGVKGPLTLLSAPAGYGKTQLLVEWAAESADRIAWLTLSFEDNDLLRFFRYLSRAFQEVDSQLGEETLDLLQSAKHNQLETALTFLINEIAAFPNNTILVLDEYHVLEAPSIIRSVNFLLMHLPPNLHLIIASRSELSLDLALLRAQGQLTELGVHELRLTNEEVGLFLQQTMGLQLPPDTIRALEERTEGWIIGLQLAAISLRNRSDTTNLLEGFGGDAHYMVDFLAQEVLDRQPDDVRQFLLRSSILDVLSGPLCEAVAGQDSDPGYGTRMLDRLEHLNLFLTPLDEQQQWFRFHNLFADFLRHMLLETHAPEIPLLHTRAAAWFEQHGNLDEAFKHGLAAGNMEWAANLIERNIEALLKIGEISTFTHWIGKMSPELIHQRPQLGVAYAWGLIATYQLDDAEFWLDAVERSLTIPEGECGEELPVELADRDRFRNIRGGLAVARSTLALISGDVQQAGEYSSQALSYLEEDNPFIRSILSLEESMYFVLLGDTAQAIEALHQTVHIARRANNLFILVAATCLLADMQAMQGRLSQALVTLEKARLIAVGPDGNPLAFAGIVDNEVGEILRERGELEEARAYLEQGQRLVQDRWSPSRVDGIISLARLLHSQGDIDQVQTLIAEAFRLALSTESSEWDDVFVSAIATRLALQRSDLNAANQWWERSGLRDSPESVALENYPYHVFEYLLLTQVRYYLAMGQNAGEVCYLHQALTLLQSVLPKAEQFKRITSKIEILILQAMIESALGESDQAVQTLLSALALGEAEDYRHIYLDEGQAMAELLALCQVERRESSNYAPSLQFIESLLVGCRYEVGLLTPEPTSSSAGLDGEVVTPRTLYDETVLLSARETEVLFLIAEGRTNQEIANQLYLALNTVKRHAYNIYAKLDVKKRTEAVAKARRLGLIP